MLTHLRPAISPTILFTLLTGFAYPLAMTGIAQTLFSAAANRDRSRPMPARLGGLGCVSCICATSKASLGTTSVSTASTASWS